MGQRCCPQMYAGDMDEDPTLPLTKTPRGQVACGNSTDNVAAASGPLRSPQKHRSDLKADDGARGVGGVEGSAAQRLLEYQKIAFLARGSFAEVTLALHKPTGRCVAVKRIAKRLVEERGKIEVTQQERALLENVRHPLIVGLHAAFQSKRNLYLVLPFAGGGDFRMLLSRWGAETKQPGGRHRYCGCQHTSAATAVVTGNGLLAKAPSQGPPPQVQQTHRRCAALLPSTADGLPLPHVFFYGTQLILALRHLHRSGVIYRDVKPENMLLGSDGHLQLADLGVAKVSQVPKAPLDKRLARSAREGSPTPLSNETFTGTIEYVSPEVLCDVMCTPATDLWGVGCVLFELINGNRPFRGRNDSELYSAIVAQEVAMDASSKNFVLSDTSDHAGNAAMGKLYDLVLRLLQRDPARRLGGTAGEADVVLRHPFFADGYMWSFFPEVELELAADCNSTVNSPERERPGPLSAICLPPRVSAPLVAKFWLLLEQRKLEPPILPQFSCPTDTSYFSDGREGGLTPAALTDYFAAEDAELGIPDMGASPNKSFNSQQRNIASEEERDMQEVHEDVFVEQSNVWHQRVSSYEQDEMDSKYGPGYQGLHFTKYTMAWKPRWTAT